MLALLVLHLCKVSCLCRCIVQRLGSADISVLAYNFWQAIKASLLWGVAPVQVVSHLCHCICALTAICAVASCNGFVWLTASILAGSRGGSPIKIAPSHGEGVWGFGKNAEIERPKALQGCKAHKAFLKGLENSHYLIKNRLFLQTEKSLALRQDSFAFYLEYYMQLMQLFALLSGI